MTAGQTPRTRHSPPAREFSPCARRVVAVAALCGAVLLSVPALATDISGDTAVLRAMDKVTGRVMEIVTPVGGRVKFGTLDLVVRTCRKHPPEETPEAAAFLDVWEKRNNEPAVSYFRGWMFSSSPALSAMEHPVYDIWVIDCSDSNGGGKASLDNNAKGSAGKSP